MGWKGKGNPKYYFRAEVGFGDNSYIYGEKHRRAEDCLLEIETFIRTYLRSNLVFCGIRKRLTETDEEFICPQNNPHKKKEIDI